MSFSQAKAGVPPSRSGALMASNTQDLEGWTLRNMLFKAWHEQDRLGKLGLTRSKAREKCLFSTGGLNDADELHVREPIL